MPIKVGFVGAGKRARGHVDVLKTMEDVQITAVCDVASEAAERMAADQGARAYVDPRKMLGEEGLDVLYVSVPTFAHGEVEILAADKGIHLFVEKPVAPTMESALEMLDAVKGSDIITSVGYQLRYTGHIQQAREFLKGRTIGMAVVCRWGSLPSTPWWRVMAQSGGQLVEQTTHQVDLMRYLVGEVEEVQAYYALRTLADVPNLDVPDVYAVNMKFENGAIGSLSSSCALRKGGGRSGMEFLLTDMRVSLGGRGLEVTPEGAADPGPVPESEDIDVVFMDAIRRNDGSKILSDFEDGARSLDVTLAANRSAETGRPERTYFSQHK